MLSWLDCRSHRVFLILFQKKENGTSSVIFATTMATEQIYEQGRNKKLMEKTAIRNGKSCAPDVWHQRRQHLWWLLANNIDRQSKDSNPYGTPDIIQFSIDISSVCSLSCFLRSQPAQFSFYSAQLDDKEKKKEIGNCSARLSRLSRRLYDRLKRSGRYTIFPFLSRYAFYDWSWSRACVFTSLGFYGFFRRENDFQTTKQHTHVFGWWIFFPYFSPPKCMLPSIFSICDQLPPRWPTRCVSTYISIWLNNLT